MSPKFIFLAAAACLMMACGGSHSNSEFPAATPLDIRGKLLSRAKQPLSGVAIVIPGKPPVNTDFTGAFTIAGVTPPYEAWIVDGANKTLVVYKGLTRSDPVLVYPESIGSIRHADVGGRITSGGSYPQLPDHRTRIVFSSSEARLTGSTDGAGAYSFTPSWRGPSNTLGAVHALQIRESSPGIPAEYKGYSKTDLTLSDGGSFGPMSISMSPVRSSTVSGSVAVPAGYTLLREVYLSVGSGPDLKFVFDTSGASSFSYVSPNIPNTSLLLWSQALKANAGVVGLRAGLAANASGVNLTIPAGAEPVLPVDAATGVNGNTTFSWSAFPNGVHLIRFTADGAGKPSYYVFTTSTTAGIPDGSSVGLGLPAAAPYHWSVEGYSPYASIDAVATTAFIDAIDLLVSADWFECFADWRSFATAP